MGFTAPDQVPDQLPAGDTWQWTRSLSDYPAGTWTLAYRFANEVDAFTVTATASGTDHAISVAASTTAGYKPGRYSWRAMVTSGAERHSIESGVLEILPDPGATGYRSVRTHARRVMEALEATIEGRATTDQLAMSIAGRSISRMSLTELRENWEKYATMVKAEERAEAINSGRSPRNRLLVRFS